jgi:hypothetical protein
MSTENRKQFRAKLGSFCLFLFFCSLTVSKAHAWTATVFVDEFNAGCFQCSAYGQIIGSSHRNLIFGDLSSTNGRDT